MNKILNLKSYKKQKKYPYILSLSLEELNKLMKMYSIIMSDENLNPYYGLEPSDRYLERYKKDKRIQPLLLKNLIQRKLLYKEALELFGKYDLYITHIFERMEKFLSIDFDKPIIKKRNGKEEELIDEKGNKIIIKI